MDIWAIVLCFLTTFLKSMELLSPSKQYTVSCKIILSQNILVYSNTVITDLQTGLLYSYIFHDDTSLNMCIFFTKKQSPPVISPTSCLENLHRHMKKMILLIHPDKKKSIKSALIVPWKKQNDYEVIFYVKSCKTWCFRLCNLSLMFINILMSPCIFVSAHCVLLGGKAKTALSNWDTHVT